MNQLRTNRMKRGVALLASPCILALSMGVPRFACVKVYDPDFSPTNNDNTPAGSLSTVGQTFDNPLLVLRDNPALGGKLEVTDPTVTGTPADKYLTGGTWTNLTGSLRVDEQRVDTAKHQQWHYVDQYSPVLPHQYFGQPGLAEYGTRAFSMVHGNTYTVTASGADPGGDAFATTAPQYLKLDDNVLVVPVVVVTRQSPLYPVQDQTVLAKHLFDFNPTYIDNASAPQPYAWVKCQVVQMGGSKQTMCYPDWMTPSPIHTTDNLLASNYDNLNKGNLSGLLHNTRPDHDETPPDDIWTQCGIQFQVVAQVTLNLPANWQNACNSGALNFGSPDVDMKAAGVFASDPAYRAYLLNDLQPMFVSYGDNSLCAQFSAHTPGKHRFIEIDANRNGTVTAHELGHALKLDHDDVDPDNLMRTAITNETNITAAQCATARNAAKTFSDRYDQFNKNIGRTYSATPPPAPTSDQIYVPGADDTGGPIDTGGGGGECVQSCGAGLPACPVAQTCSFGCCYSVPK